MIKTFSCKETKKIFNGNVSAKLPIDIQNVARRKLRIIDAAMNINDLRIPPSNHLEKLKGNLKDKYSIRINDKYRIIFKWEGDDAYEIKIENYH